MALAFDSAVLGRLELRIDLARGTVSAARRGAARAGAASWPADAAGGCEQRWPGGRAAPASVRVTPRREPLDAYA